MHRDIAWRRLPHVLRECVLVVGGVLLILGVALGLTSYLVDAQVPMHLLEWAQAHIGSKWVFLLALNLLLIVVGCLMDIFSATAVVVPLIVPLALAYGVDPIHLGIIFIANLELGFPDAAGRGESLPRLVPVRASDVRDHRGGAALAGDSRRGRPGDHLSPLADAGLPRPVSGR